jgi:hypothetical protein
MVTAKASGSELNPVRKYTDRLGHSPGTTTDEDFECQLTSKGWRLIPPVSMTNMYLLPSILPHRILIEYPKSFARFLSELGMRYRGQSGVTLKIECERHCLAVPASDIPMASRAMLWYTRRLARNL